MKKTAKGIPLLRLEDVADITQVNEGFKKIDELLGDSTALTRHENKKISDSGGVHGLEFLEEDGSLQIEKQNGQKVKFESGLDPDGLLRDLITGLQQINAKVGSVNE